MKQDKIGQHKPLTSKSQTEPGNAAPEPPAAIPALPGGAPVPVQFSVVLRYNRLSGQVSLTIIEPQELPARLVEEGLSAARDMLLRQEGAQQALAQQQVPANTTTGDKAA